MGAGVGRTVPKDEEQIQREMLFLESLVYMVSVKCPGLIQGSHQVSSNPPCGPVSPLVSSPGVAGQHLPFCPRETAAREDNGFCSGIWAHREPPGQ